MIHQLVCEGQVRDLAAAAVTLRTLRYEKFGKMQVPVSVAVTAYYVLARALVSKLMETDLFYSSDPAEENQISLILQDRTPDIVRRREQTGRLKFSPSPEELENDLRALFGKHGGPMPVYRFVCDQAEGGIMSDATGDRQVMRGVWSGKGVPDAKPPSPKEVANSVPAEGSGALDLRLPPDDDPEKCMVFDEPADTRLTSAARDVETALCAAFPEMSKRIAAEVFDHGSSANLVVSVKGGIDGDAKLKLSNFLAEYGCSDPEETFSVDGDWIGTFSFVPSSSCRELSESSDNPARVVVRVQGESDRKCWIGCARKMQDLSSFDGGEVVRAFATNRYSRGVGLAKARRCVAEGSEIVLDGSRFRVERAYVKNGNIIAEAARVLGPGELVCDFPADLVERLAGPCCLPRRDEEMFRSWKARTGEMKSYSVLGESYWCDEPAFGEPRECVKVLLYEKCPEVRGWSSEEAERAAEQAERQYKASPEYRRRQMLCQIYDTAKSLTEKIRQYTYAAESMNDIVTIRLAEEGRAGGSSYSYWALACHLNWFKDVVTIRRYGNGRHGIFKLFSDEYYFYDMTGPRFVLKNYFENRYLNNTYSFLKQNGYADLSDEFDDYIIHDGICDAYGEKSRISKAQLNDSIIVVKAKLATSDDVYKEIEKAKADLKSLERPLRSLGVKDFSGFVNEIKRSDIAGAAGKIELAELYDMQDRAFYANDTYEFNRLQSEIEKLENDKSYMAKKIDRYSFKKLVRDIEEMIFI